MERVEGLDKLCNPKRRYWVPNIWADGPKSIIKSVDRMVSKVVHGLELEG